LGVHLGPHAHEADRGGVLGALREPVPRGPGHPGDVPVPMGEVPRVGDDLPHLLRHGVHLHGHTGPGHATTVPVVHPRHHTTRTGRSLTRAAPAGSTRERSTSRAAESRPDRRRSTTCTCAWPRIIAPAMARARHVEAWSTTSAAAMD